MKVVDVSSFGYKVVFDEHVPANQGNFSTAAKKLMISLVFAQVRTDSVTRTVLNFTADEVEVTDVRLDDTSSFQHIPISASARTVRRDSSGGSFVSIRRVHC
jgi:hypothetical protein